MNARGNFHCISSSKQLKYSLWLLGLISFTIPYQNHEIWDLTARSHFRYNSLPKLSKYDLWLLGAISFTIPYQNHWNMTNDSYGQFPLQFLIKIIEIWPMTAIGHFLYNSLSKSLQDYLWLLGAINMSYDSYGPFPLQFLIKIIEIWPMTAMGNFHYNSLSKSLKYDLWQYFGTCPCWS